MRVYVYWNLHRHLFSVKDCRAGCIHNHARQVIIKNAQFVVSQAGRARVLRERQKNVHAGVRGEMALIEVERPGPGGVGTHSGGDMRGWTRVTYNPYKYDSFVRASDERPVEGADEVRLVLRDGKPRIFARGLRFKESAKAA